MTARAGERNRKGIGAAPFRRRRIGLVLVLPAALMASAVANSQVVSPSQVTPHSLRPASAPEGTISIVTAAGLTPPPNAANLSVTLSDVVVDGGFPELQDKTRQGCA